MLGGEKDTRTWSKEIEISAHLLYYCHRVISAASVMLSVFYQLLSALQLDLLKSGRAFLSKERGNWNSHS